MKPFFGFRFDAARAEEQVLRERACSFRCSFQGADRYSQSNFRRYYRDVSAAEERKNVGTAAAAETVSKQAFLPDFQCIHAAAPAAEPEKENPRAE